MAKHIEVKDEDLVLVLSAFTKGGAYVLMKRYRDKMGCEILEEPMERDDSMWVFMVSNPFVDWAEIA
jgi:hypothetical protein